MNKLKIFLIIFINLILQGTLFSRLPIFGATINLSIPILVCLSIGFGPYIGGYSSLFIGLVEDLFFSPIIGIRALIYFTFGFLIGDSDIGINKDDVRSGMILTAFITFIHLFYQYFIHSILEEPFNLLYYLKGPIFIEIILNTVVYFVVFKIFKKLFYYPRFRM